MLMWIQTNPQMRPTTSRCASSRCPEKGAHWPSSLTAAVPSSAPCNRWPPWRKDRQRSVNATEACRAGRSSDSRTLGRRSRGGSPWEFPWEFPWDLHRSVGRTTIAVRHPSQNPQKRTDAVVNALSKAVRKLPTALRKSLTGDRGSELTDYTQFTVATDVKVLRPLKPTAA